MGKKTPLYQSHLRAGAKMVDFAGWEMPLHYGSQVKEHHLVRQSAGVFDVSHMTVIDLSGKSTQDFLRYLLANNIDRLTPNKALYTCMLNEKGGVIDDLIVYYLGEDRYRLIVNSATHDKDLAWMTQQAASFQVNIQEQTGLAMLAIQGPKVKEKIPFIFVKPISELILSLKSFHCVSIDSYFIACTGYTGEKGIEVLLPKEQAEAFWEKVLSADIFPCGLGARDTLRLEAGLNLYGADMDEEVSPLESNLAWTVSFSENRDFIGRQALLAQQQAGLKQELVGLVLEGPGVLRSHQKVITDKGIGEITSGTFSPTLNKGIALARIPAGIREHCFVDVRGKQLPVIVINPPFIKNQEIKVGASA